MNWQLNLIFQPSVHQTHHQVRRHVMVEFQAMARPRLQEVRQVSAFTIRLVLLRSKLLWWLMLVTGLGLLAASITALEQESLQEETLRWLFFLSSAALSSCAVVLFVELAVPQIEARFLEALMPMPPSWGLYQMWLWSVAIYFTFQALFSWSDLAPGPDDGGKSKVAAKVEDIISVVALFTTVTLILVILCKALVSHLYSKRHSHKVVDALRQESTLAILAAIKPPRRVTEELPPEPREAREPAEPPPAPVPKTRRNSMSAIGASSVQINGEPNGEAADRPKPKRQGGLNSRQGSMMLADGLSSSDQPKAPGLGLPRAKLTPASSSNLAAIAELMENNRWRQQAAASRDASLVPPLGMSPPASARALHGQSPTMVHRPSESALQSGLIDSRTGAVIAGGLAQFEGRQLRRRTSQSKDGISGSSPHGSIGRSSEFAHAWMPAPSQPQQQQQAASKAGPSKPSSVFRKSMDTPRGTRVEHEAIPELAGDTEGEDTDNPALDQPGKPGPGQISLANKSSDGNINHVVNAAEPKGAGIAGSSVEGRASHVAVGDVSYESLTSISTRLDSTLSASPVPALAPVLTCITPDRARVPAPGRQKQEAPEVVVDIDPKGQDSNQATSTHQQWTVLSRCCGGLSAGVSNVLPSAARVWLMDTLRELREVWNAVFLLDIGTKQIRDILVKALNLQHRLRDPLSSDTHALTSLEVAAAWADRAPLRPTKSAPNLSPEQPTVQAGAQQQQGASKGYKPAEPRWIRLTSPRRLLDELLTIYAELKDGDLHNMATTYSELVFSNVCPSHPEFITRKDLFNRKIDDARLDEVWDECDKDGSGEVTKEELKVMAVSFYQQRRNLALTIHAMRNLTLSIQVAVVLLINCVFLMVVYLAMLDVTYLFGANKTSLDFFSAYIVVVSLMFGDLIKTVLSGAIFLLAQQPFDIGEDIIVEEAPDWRYKGVVVSFNLMYLTIKKSSDGELVTMPLSKITTGKFTNVSRADWKIESNLFAVDISVPRAVLNRLKEAALLHIMANPQDFDTDYGFACYFHGFEKPNKVIIRTIHRFRFNLSQPHRRSAAARDGIMEAIHRTFNEMGVRYTELRTWVRQGADDVDAGYQDLNGPSSPEYVWDTGAASPPQDALQRYYNAYHQSHVPTASVTPVPQSAFAQAPPGIGQLPLPRPAPSQQAGYTMPG